MMRQTDAGRTPDRYIDSASHTMGAVPKIGEKQFFFRAYNVFSLPMLLLYHDLACDKLASGRDHEESLLLSIFSVITDLVLPSGSFAQQDFRSFL